MDQCCGLHVLQKQHAEQKQAGARTIEQARISGVLLSVQLDNGR